MKRNGEIELWRFVAALIIIDYHCKGFRFFPFGSIGVEFFFLLSGFLLAVSAMKKTVTVGNISWREINNETFSHLSRRICSFFPETLIACILGLLVYAVAMHPDLNAFVPQAIATIFGDACFLNMSGLFQCGVNGVTWYLSTLLMGVCLIYPLVRRWGIPPFLFVVGVLLLGAIYINGNWIDGGAVRQNIGTYRGNIRGISEMLIGVSLYPIIQIFRKVAIGKIAKGILTLLKWIMCICMLCYANRANFIGYNIGFALFVLSGIIILSFSGQCFDASWYQHPVTLFLGKFSLPLYLSHCFYADCFPVLMPDGGRDKSLYIVYFFCVFVSALGVMYTAQWFRRLVASAKGTHTVGS